VAAVLEALREHCLAQAALFPVRRVLPVLDTWFIEPGFAWRLPELEAASEREEPTGLFDASNDRAKRGGFTVFVPEDYDATRRWPLVVALHGGFGHGADFVWTWLREARARGWIVLAPTSRGGTWSLHAPEVDGRSLDAMHEYVLGRWSIDTDRVLLTGLSDGATFTLLHGLAEGSPYTHLAPVSGVLHPLNFANGNLARASGRRVRWVHGALDWMFPVALAREGVAVLERAGAVVDYDEVDDLSHACPRERNGGILAWAGGAGQALV
jgi:phospholipase/carboxylesterase